MYMNDLVFNASLKSAKFAARKNPDHPDTVIRRVQFALTKTFGYEEAEWLGPIGIELLHNLQSRSLNKGEIPMDGYHGKAEFSGLLGNASANIDGIVAKATIAGTEDNEHEEITFEFEAPCEAKLLTFIGLSLKEHIDVDLKRLQLELDVGFPVVSEVKTMMAAAIQKGTSMTLEFDGRSATLEGTG